MSSEQPPLNPSDSQPLRLPPLVAGWIESETGSLKEGLLFFGVFGLLMAILPQFLDETGPSARKPTSEDE